MAPQKEHKKRRGSRAYLNDFQRSVSGEYIYTGATYSLDCRGTTRARALTGLWLPGGAALVCSAVQGCIPAPDMLSCAYVLLPYVCQLICAVSVVWALLRLSLARGGIREYVYSATVGVLPLRCGFTLGFAAAAFLGSVLFPVLHRLRPSGLSALSAALSAAAAVCAALVLIKLKKLTWLKNENPG